MKDDKKITPLTEKLLRVSEQLADETNCMYIGSEHLLLAIIRNKQGIAFNVLQKAGVDFDKLEEQIHKDLGVEWLNKPLDKFGFGK